MTKQEKLDFFAGLGKLAVMHRIKLDKPTARVYYEALHDIPSELLQRAFGYLVAHAGEFFPASERIREVVDLVQDEEFDRNRRLALEGPKRLLLESGDGTETPSGHRFCSRCDDTGYSKSCPGCNDPTTCETRQGDYCRNYKDGQYRLAVGACPCAKTNPEILRKQKLNARPKRYAGTRRRDGYFQRRAEDE